MPSFTLFSSYQPLPEDQQRINELEGHIATLEQKVHEIKKLKQDTLKAIEIFLNDAQNIQYNLATGLLRIQSSNPTAMQYSLYQAENLLNNRFNFYMHRTCYTTTLLISLLVYIYGFSSDTLSYKLIGGVLTYMSSMVTIFKERAECKASPEEMDTFLSDAPLRFNADFKLRLTNSIEQVNTLVIIDNRNFLSIPEHNDAYINIDNQPYKNDQIHGYHGDQLLNVLYKAETKLKERIKHFQHLKQEYLKPLNRRSQMIEPDDEQVELLLGQNIPSLATNIR